MDPTIPAGCSIIQTESWDGESSLEGEIVAFEPEHIEKSGYTITENIEVNKPRWIAHTVIDEYKDYDPDSAHHYINENDRLVNESTGVTMSTEQTYEDGQALENEHVLLLQGENNMYKDREIVNAENVLGILDDDRQIQIQSLSEWPCSVAE